MWPGSDNTSLLLDSIAAKCQKENVIAERKNEKHNSLKISVTSLPASLRTSLSEKQGRKTSKGKNMYLGLGCCCIIAVISAAAVFIVFLWLCVI